MIDQSFAPEIAPGYESMGLHQLSRELGEAEFAMDNDAQEAIGVALRTRIDSFTESRALSSSDQELLINGVYRATLGRKDELRAEAKAAEVIALAPQPEITIIQPPTDKQSRVRAAFSRLGDNLKGRYQAARLGNFEEAIVGLETTREQVSDRTKKVGGVALLGVSVYFAYQANKHGIHLGSPNHAAKLASDHNLVPKPRGSGAHTVVTQHNIAVPKSVNHLSSKPAIHIKPRVAQVKPPIRVKQPVVNLPHLNTKPPVNPNMNYSHPWNWAESVGGRGHGSEVIQKLSDKARTAGHKVVWHGSGDSSWVEIDGHSDSGTVVGILQRFKV